MRDASCHPARAVHGRGLCGPCYKREWAKSNRHRNVIHKMRHKYGLEPAEYDLLLDAQDGRCAICRRPERMRGRNRLSIDHDHKTGRVRGLLCGHCNQGLGLLGDDPTVLTAALRYLDKEAS